MLGVVALQCLLRKQNASKCLLQLKVARHLRVTCSKEVESATKIATAWRRFHCQIQYDLKTEGMVHLYANIYSIVIATISSNDS